MPPGSFNKHSTTTGHPCTPVITCSATKNSKVKLQGQNGLVKGDPVDPHTILSGNSCVPHPGQKITGGSGKVFYMGNPAARIGDAADGGAMIGGSSKVIVG